LRQIKVSLARNANDHERERCAYIRRHPLNFVAVSATEPVRLDIAAPAYMGMPRFRRKALVKTRILSCKTRLEFDG
jgi:hypothetical protein